MNIQVFDLPQLVTSRSYNQSFPNKMWVALMAKTSH